MKLAEKMGIKKKHLESAAVAGLVTVALGTLFVGAAVAGTDSTFATAVTTVKNFIEGSYGRLASLGVVATGIAMSIVKHDVMFLAGAVGVALAANIAPGALTTMVSFVM